MGQAFFITGTDTGVGKTLIATALLHRARAAGLSTLGLKPVAAGCEQYDGQWMNTDARELMLASSCSPAYATVNPVALRTAIAPHIAAEQEAQPLRAAKLISHCRALLDTADFTVIEGAGGWLVPLNATETMADVAQGIARPVLLVVGLRLGCINHALLTANAITAAGLPLAGWIGNQIDPDMTAADANVATLKQRLAAPLLGCVPYLSEPDAQVVGRLLTLPEMHAARSSLKQ